MSHNILSLNNWFLRERKTKDAKLSLGIFTFHKQNLKIQKTFQNPITFTASSIKKLNKLLQFAWFFVVWL